MVAAIVVALVAPPVLRALRELLGPAVDEWREERKLAREVAREERARVVAPVAAVAPCGCEALRNTSEREIGELLRHAENIYQAFHEGRTEAAASSPLTAIKVIESRTKTITEFIDELRREKKAAELAQNLVDKKEIADAARAIREHTNPGKDPK